MVLVADDLAALKKLPLEEFVAVMDARHRAALVSSAWWLALKAAHPDWNDSGVGMSFDSAVLRRRFPTHFVMGLTSPFYSEGIASPDRTHSRASLASSRPKRWEMSASQWNSGLYRPRTMMPR